MSFYDEIKNKLINNEINRKVKNYSINKSDLDTYYFVRKMLTEAGKHYGDGIIKEYSKRLILEVNKKYNETNLKRMRQFYHIILKGATLWHQLSWSHYKLLIPLKNIDTINYYSSIATKKSCSVRQLELIIKFKEFERLNDDTKLKLINNIETNVTDFIPNPILINNKNNYDNISEKVLQKIILEDISSFLEELGIGFTFIKNEYKITIGNTFNYIDILLFNINYNCYVVVELKITPLKKEHIGQIQVYMNYIDKNIRSINHNKTIGIIIVKKDNKCII